MKICTIVGARPQFIKASVVSAEITQNENISEVVVHTGQHFDENMSGIFFEELGMKKPSFCLDIHGGGHGEMTGRMLCEIERVLCSEKPDIVLVYGDTNSTIAGSLAAIKLQIPIAHVEAGLRSFNMRMPEEVNRIVTDRISTWLFTPTKEANENLLREGTDLQKISLVGDVMYDVSKYYGQHVKSQGKMIERLDLTPENYVLATIHRAENTNDIKRIKNIVAALSRLSQEIEIVWPMHPRTRNILSQTGIHDLFSNRIKITDPVSYLEMLQLEKYASLIVTDSGGVQKEAFFNKTPCVTLRDETEWVELIDSGWNKIAPPVCACQMVDIMKSMIGAQGDDIHPYGKGDAAKRIVSKLLSE